MAVKKIATIERWTGLAADDKPTSVSVGSTFLEYDTDKIFITYDGTNWVLKDNRARLVTATGDEVTDDTADAVKAKLSANTGVDIGDVDVLSIAAGTNVLGKVRLVDSAGDEVTDAAGNAVYTKGVANSGVDIGDVDVLTLPSVTLADAEQKPSITPAIYNVTMTLADTEYSQALPASCRQFVISMRENDTAFRMAFVTGKVAAPTTPYYTIPIGVTHTESEIRPAAQTLYFACASAAKNIQIIAWV